MVSEAVENGIFRGIEVGENKCFEEVSGLKVNYNKSKIYGNRVNEEDMTEMANWMRGGLNIGSLKAKYMALLGKWWGRFRRDGKSLWVRVIKSIHGPSGGMGEGRALRTNGDGSLEKMVSLRLKIYQDWALKGRLPVQDALDRRCIDLDSVLCPSCNNGVETSAHCLTTCGFAMSVLEKIFNWWKARSLHAFSINELFSSTGSVNVPPFLSRVWQAVIWSTGYFIWKERNTRVFGNKVSSTNKVVQDIQLKNYVWIMRRSNKFKVLDWQQCLRDPMNCNISNMI
ncbi:reverse transcriptase domain, reverse transcriptase zinc-binding domain protein [Tanacetum coccineum]